MSACKLSNDKLERLTATQHACENRLAEAWTFEKLQFAIIPLLDKVVMFKRFLKAHILAD